MDVGEHEEVVVLRKKMDERKIIQPLEYTSLFYNGIVEISEERSFRSSIEDGGLVVIKYMVNFVN